jgi:type II secretory pathway predicted ATPase ExeA
MNYLHFALSGPPFEGGSSPATLFMSREHREALSTMEWGAAQVTSGFSLLVGEVGTGKTTLVNAFLMPISRAWVRRIRTGSPA